MTTTSSSELLTFAQAAARLGVGVLDVRRLVRTEQCPVVTPAAATVYPAVGLTIPPGG